MVRVATSLLPSGVRTSDSLALYISPPWLTQVVSGSVDSWPSQSSICQPVYLGIDTVATTSIGTSMSALVEEHELSAAVYTTNAVRRYFMTPGG